MLNALFLVFMIYSTKNIIIVAFVFSILELIVLYFGLRVVSFSKDKILYNTLFGEQQIDWSNIKVVEFYNGWQGKNFFYIERYQGKRIRAYWNQQFKDDVMKMCETKNVKATNPKESWVNN